MILNESNELNVEQEWKLGTLELDVRVGSVVVFIQKESLIFQAFVIGGNGSWGNEGPSSSRVTWFCLPFPISLYLSLPPPT